MGTISGLFNAGWAPDWGLPKAQGDKPRFELPPGLALLCQLARLAAVAAVAVRLFNVVNFHLHCDWMIQNVRDYLHLDISGVTWGQMAGAAVVNVAVLSLLQAGIYLSIFQLFTGFLRGEIFTVEAALRLRRAGLFALAFVVASPLREFLAVGILTAGLPTGPHWAIPPLGTFIAELSDLALGGLGVAMGQIFKFAAALARESEDIL